MGLLNDGTFVFDPHTCCVSVTGHRPSKFSGGFNRIAENGEIVKAALRAELLKLRPAIAITGMALGVNIWFAEVCLELGIHFVAAVPCDGQEAMWSVAQQQHYRNMLGHATWIHNVSPGPYAAWKMMARNKWMVDRANVVIGVWDGSEGGTKNCLDYATKINKPTIILPCP